MEWPHILNLNLNNFIKNGHMTKYETLRTNTNRISYILNEKGINLDDYLEQNIAQHQSKKSSSLSDDLRKKGNSFYSLKTKNQEAFSLYTEALANAPVSTNKTFNGIKSLILAYSNRSALFLDEKLFGHCLNDIKTAMTHFEGINFEQDQIKIVFNLLFKLLNRQRVCFVQMAQLNELINFKTNPIYTIILSDIFKDINETRTIKLNELLTEIKTDLTKLKLSSHSPLKTENNKSLNECLVTDLMSIEFTEAKGNNKNCFFLDGLNLIMLVF